MTKEQDLHSRTNSRLALLMTLLESDPDNRVLLFDAAGAALADGQGAEAIALLDRAAGGGPLAPAETNLRGLAEMQLGRFDRAAAAFESLRGGEGGADPTLRSNLAWAKAMAKDQEGALDLLDDETARVRPEAAMLRVQLLHDRGHFDEAAALARDYVELHPDHRGLLAAVSVLALDVEDRTLAARCAAGAGDHPDALATLGTLALGDDRGAEAWDLFDGAIRGNEGVPRAWI
ncbi:MAG: hypothetical protein QOI38_1233, partial [Sphingomonadales bacterium]|nr:hypothetical protein [Sphingomonadales bacterium]